MYFLIKEWRNRRKLQDIWRTNRGMCSATMAVQSFNNFSHLIDGVVRDMKAWVGNFGVDLCKDLCTKWKLNMILFPDDVVLTADNQRDLQKFAKEFDIVCQRHN